MSISSIEPTKRQRLWPRLRLLILLGFLGAALTLMQWSRAHDPRFFWFVQSAPGRVLADALSWQTGVRPLHKVEPESRWSTDERNARDALLLQLTAEAPDIRLTLRDGREVTGNLVFEGDQELKVETVFGAGMTVTSRIPTDRIAGRQTLETTPPTLNRRDVAFHQEFPEYGFYRRPPFTIVTDRSVFDAEDAVGQLVRLHQRLLIDFEDLIRYDETPDGIQLLFFSNETSYREYTESIAQHLEFSSGFYTPAIDRLVWFDQAGSDESAELRQRIDERASASQKHAFHPQHRAYIEQAARRARNHLSEAANHESRKVLRHEGAHQLLFTLGIHSDHLAENPWLLEGLAQYYEDGVPGTIPRSHRTRLRSPIGDDPVTLETLITLRSPQGLHAFEDPEHISLAYVRSAALIRWMMAPERRPQFIAYLKSIRDPANVWTAATEDRITLLAHSFGESRDAFLNRLHTEAF